MAPVNQPSDLKQTLSNQLPGIPLTSSSPPSFPGKVNTFLSPSELERSACPAAAWGLEAPVEPRHRPPPDTRRPARLPPSRPLIGAARCPSGRPTLLTNHRAARRPPAALPAPITSCRTPFPILRRWPTPRARLLTEVRSFFFSLTMFLISPLSYIHLIWLDFIDFIYGGFLMFL